MPWYIWCLVIDIALSAIWKVTQVGAPRDPVTPVEAACQVVVSAVYLVLFLTWAL